MILLGIVSRDIVINEINQMHKFSILGALHFLVLSKLV